MESVILNSRGELYVHIDKVCEYGINQIIQAFKPTREREMEITPLNLAQPNSYAFIIQIRQLMGPIDSDFDIDSEMPDLMQEWETEMAEKYPHYDNNTNWDYTQQDIIICINLSRNPNAFTEDDDTPPLHEVIREVHYPHQSDGNAGGVALFIRDIQKQIEDFQPDSEKELENLKYGFQRLIGMIEAELKTYK